MAGTELEVYLTADGARELILTLQRQIKDALTTLDEAIRLVKARTAEADASHALAIHNFRCASEHEREKKVLRALLREARNYLGDDADLNARIDAALGKQDG